MTWIWVAVLAIVLVFGGGFTPWDTLTTLLQHHGVDEAGAGVIGFVAGFTLPLTAGVFLIALLALTNLFPNVQPPWGWVLIAVILAGSGAIAQALGLGLLPDYAGTFRPEGPWAFWPLEIVAQAYLNAYGWSLAVCAIAIGVAAAIHVERMVHDSGHA